MVDEPREDPPADPSAAQDEERPPFGSWRQLYTLVLVVLALQVALYALFGAVYR